MLLLIKFVLVSSRVVSVETSLPDPSNCVLLFRMYVMYICMNEY